MRCRVEPLVARLPFRMSHDRLVAKDLNLAAVHIQLGARWMSSWRADAGFVGGVLVETGFFVMQPR